MGLEWKVPSGSGDAGSNTSSEEVGPSSSSTAESGGVRRFPVAAQPEIMRAAEKDEQYASFVYDGCRDAFRHLFGTRVAVVYQSETKLLGQMLYYILTTGSGQQTLGEEYCDITQVSGSYGLPPTPARRALFIVYHTAVPYIAERISSRIASRGSSLTDSLSDHLYGNDAPGSSQVQSSAVATIPSAPASGANVSVLSRLKQKISGLWLYAIRTWPSMLPLAREFLQLVLRTNLMFFYFEGLYYHISKRAAGIRYVFIGKQMNQRPSHVAPDPVRRKIRKRRRGEIEPGTRVSKSGHAMDTARRVTERGKTRTNLVDDDLEPFDFDRRSRAPFYFDDPAQLCVQASGFLQPLMVAMYRSSSLISN
ncbi:hypothetical protein TEA_021547 [Camellia sinensis var. sinensis]|uniref:RING-type E3 ubiquitin transferase n=1 Tax=Camellia sinensis var. sinensis TaxID=542762 RepID=A0A4S4EUH2_CAMSN|nr:hypothetical protein TEA_021547 [Camellia sinensis var. sinensis]